MPLCCRLEKLICEASAWSSVPVEVPDIKYKTFQVIQPFRMWPGADVCIAANLHAFTIIYNVCYPAEHSLVSWNLHLTANLALKRLHSFGQCRKEECQVKQGSSERAFESVFTVHCGSFPDSWWCSTYTVGQQKASIWASRTPWRYATCRHHYITNSLL